MATLLSAIAQRCITEYEGMTLSQFYGGEALEIYGYCTDRMVGVLLEEALTRKPATMGRCIAEAEQDKDLEVAFKRLDYLIRDRRWNALDRLRHDFMVVLAHEIKAQLMAMTSTARI